MQIDIYNPSKNSSTFTFVPVAPRRLKSTGQKKLDFDKTNRKKLTSLKLCNNCSNGFCKQLIKNI